METYDIKTHGNTVLGLSMTQAKYDEPCAKVSMSGNYRCFAQAGSNQLSKDTRVEVLPDPIQSRQCLRAKQDGK